MLAALLGIFVVTLSVGVLAMPWTALADATNEDPTTRSEFLALAAPLLTIMAVWLVIGVIRLQRSLPDRAARRRLALEAGGHDPWAKVAVLAATLLALFDTGGVAASAICSFGEGEGCGLMNEPTWFATLTVLDLTALGWLVHFSRRAATRTLNGSLLTSALPALVASVVIVSYALMPDKGVAGSGVVIAVVGFLATMPVIERISGVEL